jgi:hypothetical protein
VVLLTLENHGVYTTAKRRRRPHCAGTDALDEALPIARPIVCMANCRFVSVPEDVAILQDHTVRDLAVLFLHLLATIARPAGPGGARSVVAESGVREAPTADPQSLPQAVPESPLL